ncbi:DUF6705 family protein [Chryseobacterium turcicum]|uniref:DUF6705 domain-containing protein n=1 Tax=Chryseobacterium turcicum TaxID=2898076 RepID=A0A9Q3V340_9FLAO|nr:DUF6705 family protein [Chryseobacterium turcicum]MCD1116209.1 hypothetical protein [Chryseobacterium turcicum]
MKSIIIFYGLFVVLSCKAQQLPLNTLMKDIPANGYIKDTNNELNSYVGTYKTNYQGNEIILIINKEENKPTRRMNKDFYRDALVVKYIVKNSAGNILQNTQNMILNDQTYFNIVSIGTIPSLGIVSLGYDGTNCGIGWGKIILKKLNTTQFSWDYRPNNLVIDDATCPPSVDKKVYLPITKDLIFTKQ